MLDNPVTTLKGIGDKTFEDLRSMGIETIEDLILYFPYRYDVHEIKPLQELLHEDKVTVEGRVLYEPSLSFYGRNRSRLIFTIEVEMVAVRVVMFNRGFLKDRIKQGETITVIGKWDANRLQVTANYLSIGTAKDTNEIQSFYSLKGKLQPARFRTFIKQALDEYSAYVNEILPEHYLKNYRLPKRIEAIITMHFPENKYSLKHARRRFIYEEFLLFQLRMQLLRQMTKEQSSGNAQKYNRNLLKSFIKNLPYTLTHAQKRALKEILRDLLNPSRMNRLLQGDVGSGKTAVAAISLYASVTANKQGALMVPTEILAEQHFESLLDMFPRDVKIDLLTSSVTGKKRKQLLEALKNGDIDILIGTHALIQEDVEFNELGLVIVDEQHRFGVKQRRNLREKGLHPDVLFMTATPIPRTLAITAFGDMDVSVLDELPKGRKEIKTFWTKEESIEQVLSFMKKHLDAGEQAYVVCPLIEESDKMDIQNAVDVYQQFQHYYKDTYNVGLLHGRLHADEKEDMMRKFQANEIQVLVATTVIEVGVNVPNATVMVIYDAERFGLSQLHQLRGRVGRGQKQSYCILIADPKGDTGKERMQIMTETNDGFELSEADLKLRGPGDFFGSKQSGLPEFKVADMIHDYRALETARVDAINIIHENYLEKNPAYKKLAELVHQAVELHEKFD